MRVCKLLRYVRVNDFLIDEIGLVADQQAIDAFDSIALDFSQPEERKVQYMTLTRSRTGSPGLDVRECVLRGRANSGSVLCAGRGLHVTEPCSTHLICYIVNDNDAMCTSVVTGCDSSKAFLTCRIPDLQLDCLALEVERSDLEVHANCRYVCYRASGLASALRSLVNQQHVVLTVRVGVVGESEGAASCRMRQGRGGITCNCA